MTTDNKPGFVPETSPDPSYPCGPLSNIRECASDLDHQTRVVATTHELKIAPEHFEEQNAGTKLFELRADDRGFKAGDFLRLREYANDSYTSREVTRLVVGLLRGPTLGLSEGWVILSTAPQGQAPAQTAPLDGDQIDAARAAQKPETVPSWEAIRRVQVQYAGILKAAINLLASVEDRHDSEPLLKYTIPCGAVDALRAALTAAPVQKQVSGKTTDLNRNSGPELRSLYDVTGDVKDINTVLLSRAESQTTQPSTWKLAPVTWSESKEPNERIRYTHVVAETALGTFTIQWKGWKGNDSPCVYLNGEYLSTEPTIEAAKAWVTKHLQKIVNGLVVTEQPAQPRLKVWLTSFPESNGKTNWTAMLSREEKWDGLPGNAGGITLDRGEMWNRVAYEAERARFLLGQRDTEPYILDYGDDVKTPEEWKGELLGPLFDERKQTRREERSRAKAQADAESKTE